MSTPVPTTLLKSAFKPAAKKPQPKVETKVETKVEVAERKPSIQTQKPGLSSRKGIENTRPCVVMRKPTTAKGTATRMIVNFILVFDTEDASYVKSMRVAVVDHQVFGTNFGQGSIDLRKARVFAYGPSIRVPRTARTAMPYDAGNETLVRALEKLGLITKYELEYHLETTAKLKAAADVATKAKLKAEQAKKDLTALTKLVKDAIKANGIVAVRGALKKASSALLGPNV
jgi:hypothetical protein